MTDRCGEWKKGDHVTVPDALNAYNRRNGLPRYRVQEVLAVLKPGERACDHGYHEPVVGYLNDGEQRLLINNQVGSRLRPDWFFWPLKHDAPDVPPPKYSPVSFTPTHWSPV